MGDNSIEDKKTELIRVTEDPDFQNEVYQYAYKLTGNRTDAKKYAQEALIRFISMVKNKTSLKELERMRPLLYVFMILDTSHRDRRS